MGFAQALRNVECASDRFICWSFMYAALIVHACVDARDVSARRRTDEAIRYACISFGYRVEDFDPREVPCGVICSSRHQACTTNDGQVLERICGCRTIQNRHSVTHLFA